MNMKLLPVALATTFAIAATAQASNMDHGNTGPNPMVGGAAMLPSKDIIDNAVNSKDHTTLVAAVKAAGRLDAQALAAKIKAGKGKAMLTTVQGAKLTVRSVGNAVTVTDAKGNTAKVGIANVYQSNGVIHVVDKVLMP